MYKQDWVWLQVLWPHQIYQIFLPSPPQGLQCRQKTGKSSLCIFYLLLRDLLCTTGDTGSRFRWHVLQCWVLLLLSHFQTFASSLTKVGNIKGFLHCPEQPVVLVEPWSLSKFKNLLWHMGTLTWPDEVQVKTELGPEVVSSSVSTKSGYLVNHRSNKTI